MEIKSDCPWCLGCVGLQGREALPSASNARMLCLGSCCCCYFRPWCRCAVVIQLPRQRRQLQDMKKKATLHLACLVTSFRHHIQFHLCHHHRQYAQHFSMATLSMSLQHQWFLRHLSHGLRLLLDMLQHQSLKALLWTGEGTSPGLDQPLTPSEATAEPLGEIGSIENARYGSFVEPLTDWTFTDAGVSMLWQDARYDIASVS